MIRTLTISEEYLDSQPSRDPGASTSGRPALRQAPARPLVGFFAGAAVALVIGAQLGGAPSSGTASPQSPSAVAGQATPSAPSGPAAAAGGADGSVAPPATDGAAPSQADEPAADSGQKIARQGVAPDGPGKAELSQELTLAAVKAIRDLGERGRSRPLSDSGGPGFRDYGWHDPFSIAAPSGPLSRDLVPELIIASVEPTIPPIGPDPELPISGTGGGGPSDGGPGNGRSGGGGPGPGAGAVPIPSALTLVVLGLLLLSRWRRSPFDAALQGDGHGFAS